MNNEKFENEFNKKEEEFLKKTNSEPELSTKPLEAGEAEAHDEANMMRSLEDFSPEDYQGAFEVIEQLKAAAEDESTFAVVANKILRAADRTQIEILSKVDSVGSMFSLGGHIYADSMIIAEEYAKNIEKSKQRFQDAEKKLQDMMEKGKEFGENEGE